MGKRILSHKLAILFVFLISILYFMFRVPHLTLQPIFADEAIYIRWAQVMRAEPTLRFLPLSDGKTPLFMWTMAPLFKIFSDPLFAGRFLSVISGVVTLAGVLFLGWKFFGKNVGFWAAFLVAVVPFTVFFDRMALVDSMLTAFFIWTLNLALLLIKFPRLDLAMFLGYAFGGGLLTKPPGIFGLLVLPFTLITFNWSRGGRWRQLLKILGLWLVTLIVTMTIYNILRLGPGFSGLNSRNQEYVFAPLNVIKRPLDPFLPHLNDLLDWLPRLLTIPVLLLVIGGAILAIKRKNPFAVTILMWATVPLIIQMALLKTFTARYILFSIPPLLVLAGWALSSLISRFKHPGIVSAMAAVVLLSLPLNFDRYLLTNPEKAPLPKEERRGYLEDWSAGYGLKEIANFLIQQSKIAPVVVGTEGSFGTLPDGLQIYLDRDRQVVVIGGGATISAELRTAAKDHPTYFVSNLSRFAGAKEVKLLREYPKAVGTSIPRDSILLFKVEP